MMPSGWRSSDRVAGADRAADVAEQIARKTYQRGIGTGFRDSAPRARTLARRRELGRSGRAPALAR